jgi:hypothetical protein
VLTTPVALVLFNRPDVTARVFGQIAQVKPKRLYLIADGPRIDRPDDVHACQAARDVVEHVDWDCEVFRNYSEVNLGCGLRPATGFSWLFEQVEEAIILEDDCVPHPTFFPFCEELLERYRDDRRVVSIGALNSEGRRSDDPLHQYSYHFSRILATWGWATWRRAWQQVDMKLSAWPEVRSTGLLMEMVGDARIAERYARLFDRAHAAAGQIDFWDYQWVFAGWLQNGFAAMPNGNLVSNIGFGSHGTHTKDGMSRLSAADTEPMRFPLVHPPYLIHDRESDRLHFARLPDKRRGWMRKIRSRMKRVAGRG